MAIFSCAIEIEIVGDLFSGGICLVKFQLNVCNSNLLLETRCIEESVAPLHSPRIRLLVICLGE